jgi:DNA-binding NarL/FixJ family response regulator
MVSENGSPEDKVVPISAARRPAELAVAMLSAPQLAQDLIGHWLRQVAGSCQLVVAGDAAELRAMQAGCDRPRFDLVVIGHCLHPGRPELLFDQLRALEGLPVPVVVLAGDDDGQLIGEALRHGVRGYIPTRLPLPVAVAALRLVLSGGTYAPPIFTATAPPPPGLPPAALERLQLSPRETEVLRLLRLGCSNRQIAVKLGISENTVMVHMRHLLRKLGATNRAQAVYKAARMLGAEGEIG